MMAGGQGQAPADLAIEVVQRPAGVIQHVENLIGARQQGPARLGQADFAAQPVEQPELELLLDAGNAFADGRLGQKQAFGSPGKAAGFSNGDKSIEIREIHLFEFLLVIQSMKIMNLSYSL